jgi:hypothetical protein
VPSLLRSGPLPMRITAVQKADVARTCRHVCFLTRCDAQFVLGARSWFDIVLQIGQICGVSKNVDLVGFQSSDHGNKAGFGDVFSFSAAQDQPDRVPTLV